MKHPSITDTEKDGWVHTACRVADLIEASEDTYISTMVPTFEETFTEYTDEDHKPMVRTWRQWGQVGHLTCTHMVPGEAPA